MGRLSILVNAALLLALTSCGCTDNFVGDVFSPDHKLKAELRQCGCETTTGRYTQVTVLRAEQSEKCSSVATGIAGFKAPFDHSDLEIKWTANDTLESSHPDFPPGKFPFTQWSNVRPQDPDVKLVFPK